METTTFVLSTVTTLVMALIGYVLKMSNDRMNRLERSHEAQSQLLNSVKEDVLIIKAMLKE
jgi:hypothetical protein